MCGTGNPLHHRHCATCESKLPEVQMVRLQSHWVNPATGEHPFLLENWSHVPMSLCYQSRESLPNVIFKPSPPTEAPPQMCLIYLQVSDMEVRIVNAIKRAQKALRKSVVLTPRESCLYPDYFQLQWKSWVYTSGTSFTLISVIFWK